MVILHTLDLWTFCLVSAGSFLGVCTVNEMSGEISRFKMCRANVGKGRKQWSSRVNAREYYSHKFHPATERWLLGNFGRRGKTTWQLSQATSHGPQLWPTPQFLVGMDLHWVGLGDLGADFHHSPRLVHPAWMSWCDTQSTGTGTGTCSIQLYLTTFILLKITTRGSFSHKLGYDYLCLVNSRLA